MPLRLRHTQIYRSKAIVSVLIASAAVLLGGPAAQATSPVVEGSVFAGEVVPTPGGCSTDPASGPAPTIDWRDSTQSPGTCTASHQGVNTGPHTYAEEGSYAAVANYPSFSNGTQSAPFQVQVADAALNATSSTVTATAGVPFSGVVAHFSDADPDGTTADYTATIGWGDGSSSPGIVQPSGAGFDVSGGHTYGSAGSYALTIAVGDAGGASANASGSATVSAASTTTSSTSTSFTTTSSTSPSSTMTATTPSAVGGPPSDAPPAQASFTLPSGIGAGQTAVLDAAASRQPGVEIASYQWTVNGGQLANCAGATSQVMTRTLPPGNDTIALNLIASSGGSLATTSHTILVRPTAPGAHIASIRGRVHIVNLPPEAVCRLGPNDPASGRVSPPAAYAPNLMCRTQVQSGAIDAVGCLTEHQDPIQVAFVRHEGGGLGTNHVTLPAGQTILDGASGLETLWLLLDVQRALNPPQPRVCVDSRGNDIICSTVGNEQQPAGPRFGGGPVQVGGPVAGVGARAIRTATATAAGASSSGAAVLAGAACTTAVAFKTETGCLDLWVSNLPVRINGIDYAPKDGGELVIAPQFNLVVSESVSGSLDGFLLNSTKQGTPSFRPINYELPSSQGGGGSTGVDYPALTVPDLPAEIAKQRGTGIAPAVLAALSSVGGFPSVTGPGSELNITFDNQTATITFHVEVPKEFTGGDGAPLTAEVKARIGPTEPFHVVYGYLGNKSGGSGVDLGPVAISGFGLCYREHYSTIAADDPCHGITNIDDSGLADHTWMASASLNIADALNVEFRPGSNTIAGCSQDIPLGFAFSGDGGLSQAGAAIDLSGSGGVPIFSGVFVTGVAAGFTSHVTPPSTSPDYEQFSGCLALNALEVVTITGNVFGVKTANNYRYQFTGGELGTGVLRQVGGGYPYTTHLGIGVSGVVSLSLPDLPSFQLASAYALYVDDPAAIFVGGGFDFGFPGGNYENTPNTGIGIRGGVAGAIGLRGGFPFDLEAYADVVVQVRPVLGEFTVLRGGLQALMSYAPGGRGGLGLCGYASLFDGALDASAGIAFPWGDTFTIAGLYDVFKNHATISLDGNVCADNWLDRQIGVNVQTASVGDQEPRASIAAAQVPEGLNAVNLDVQSATGSPDVTVTGPGGERASTAGAPIGKAVRNASFTLVRVPALQETFIIPAHPRAGRYRITLNAGSPPITRIIRAEGFRPAINAHVGGRGTHRRLVYRFMRRPGQSVEFFEISGQVHRALGTTAGGHGSIAFTASPGQGRRQIIAEVYGDGAPRLRMTVTSYMPPSLTRLGRVRHLRVRHSGARATVTFAGVPGATDYRVYMALSDGTRQLVTTRPHRATFGPIFIDSGGTITVQAIGDGLNTVTGPAVRAKLAPLFGPGRPALRRGRTRHRHR